MNVFKTHNQINIEKKTYFVLFYKGRINCKREKKKVDSIKINLYFHVSYQMLSLFTYRERVQVKSYHTTSVFGLNAKD